MRFLKNASGFVPISIEDYAKIHLRSNPGEKREDVIETLEHTLAEFHRGKKCHCGRPLWILGSAFVGAGCFTCITGESVPDGDYEIAHN